jgi:hypothetical protein
LSASASASLFCLQSSRSAVSFGTSTRLHCSAFCVASILHKRPSHFAGVPFGIGIMEAQA